MEYKYMKVKSENKEYDILYRIDKKTLLFKDIGGGNRSCFFIFVKNKGRLTTCIGDGYSKNLWANYPNLKGINAYTLAKEQVEILMNWLNKK